MKLLTVFALLVVAGLVVLFFFFKPFEPSASSNGLIQTKSFNDSDFLTYKDKNYSFSFKYPVGYQIGFTQPPAYLAVTASTPNGPSEGVKFFISNSGVQLATEMASSLSSRSESVSGTDYYFEGQSVDDVLQEKFFVNGLSKKCGSFDLVVFTAVPVAQAPDVEVMKFVLASVKC